jgi:putative phosphoesterase
MDAIIIGLVSDTHGLFRPSITDALAGVSLILHAGDVGGNSVLQALGAIAPVRAVSGNVDPQGPPLAAYLRLDMGGLSIHVSHGHELGSPAPHTLLARYQADIIVFGHTHKPLVHREGTRLVVNPGAVGARRFHLKPSVAKVRIADGTATAEIIRLPD